MTQQGFRQFENDGISPLTELGNSSTNFELREVRLPIDAINVMVRSFDLIDWHEQSEGQKGIQAQMELDEAILGVLNPVRNPWLYTFVLRYCSCFHYEPATKGPRGTLDDSHNGANPRIHDGMRLSWEKPLPMRFFQLRGSSCNRLTEIPLARYELEQTPHLKPATESVLLESIAYPKFLVGSIKLALWPSASWSPVDKVHCAIFLLAGSSQCLKRTIDYQIDYKTDYTKPTPDGLLSQVPSNQQDRQFQGIAVRPREFDSTVEGIDTAVTRSATLDLGNRVPESGVVTEFGSDSPLSVHVRVPQSKPHLFLAHSSTSRIDVQQFAARHTTKMPHDSNDVSDLLTPHAVFEFDELATTIHFNRSVMTSAILIKFWSPDTNCPQQMLRVLEVRGSPSPEVSEHELKPSLSSM